MAENDINPFPSVDGADDMPAAEARLRQEMHGYANTVRQLAYTVPNGVGEQALLRLSQHMVTTANQSSDAAPTSDNR